MWTSSNRAPPHLNYNLPSEMGVVGLRDLFFVAPDNHASSTALGVGVGVFPLLSTQSCLPDSNAKTCNPSDNNATSTTGIHHFWQNQNQAEHPNYCSNGAGTATCQDCGNQAKKDCSHRRCRSCCKSRGFACSTHVKSTWVPAARRRERQLMVSGGNASSGSTSGGKKPRLAGCAASQMTTASHTSNSNDTSSSHHHQDGSFKETLPGQVKTPAVFRCVRVTALEEGEDEYAYQAMVKIGGHVFKGFLYDQGIQTSTDTNLDHHHQHHPCLSDLHLGSVRNNSSSVMLDAAVTDVFNATGSLFGGGAPQFGNQMN